MFFNVSHLKISEIKINISNQLNIMKSQRFRADYFAEKRKSDVKNECVCKSAWQREKKQKREFGRECVSE